MNIDDAIAILNKYRHFNRSDWARWLEDSVTSGDRLGRSISIWMSSAKAIEVAEGYERETAQHLPDEPNFNEETMQTLRDAREGKGLVRYDDWDDLFADTGISKDTEQQREGQVMKTFSPYTLPIGTEFTLGKRRWKLVNRMDDHPDHMTFDEMTKGETDSLRRKFYPSEIQGLYDAGIVFSVPVDMHAGQAAEAEPDRPLTRRLINDMRCWARDWHAGDNTPVFYGEKNDFTRSDICRLLKEWENKP